MDSKLRCVFEMPNENDKLVSKKRVRNCHTLTSRISRKFVLNFFLNLFDLLIKCIVGICTKLDRRTVQYITFQGFIES